MNRIIILFLLLFLSCSAGTNKSKNHIYYPKKIEWKELFTGLYYSEIKNPYHSKISDNIITLVKANPQLLDVDIYSNTSFDSIKRTAINWSEDFDLNVVVNAGMYNLNNTSLAEGYLKSQNKINNGRIKENFKMFAFFKPINNDLKPFDLIDAEYESVQNFIDKYESGFQSIRMIDCNGNQVIWKPKRTIYSSMCVLANDIQNNLIIAFTRSPMSANQMSALLLHLPLNIRSAMYLEGGPEACLYIKTPDTVISKKGSYVSLTFPTDTNTRYWQLPNVIGIKKK
ncbi:MAG: hypothetical protein ACUVQP_00465 [Bacteroidales bacterium]